MLAGTRQTRPAQCLVATTPPFPPRLGNSTSNLLRMSSGRSYVSFKTPQALPPRPQKSFLQNCLECFAPYMDGDRGLHCLVMPRNSCSAPLADRGVEDEPGPTLALLSRCMNSYQALKLGLPPGSTVPAPSSSSSSPAPSPPPRLGGCGPPARLESEISGAPGLPSLAAGLCSHAGRTCHKHLGSKREWQRSPFSSSHDPVPLHRQHFCQKCTDLGLKKNCKNIDT